MKFFQNIFSRLPTLPRQVLTHSPLDIIYYTLIIGKSQVVILHKLSLEFWCRVHKSRIPAAWVVRGRAKKREEWFSTPRILFYSCVNRNFVYGLISWVYPFTLFIIEVITAKFKFKRLTRNFFSCNKISHF